MPTTPLELCIEGVTEDAEPYRDTLYLNVEDGTDVLAAVRSICAANELTLTELAFSDPQTFEGSGLTPAYLDRDAFLAGTKLLPSLTEAFSAPSIFIDLHDEGWAPYGWEV